MRHALLPLLLMACGGPAPSEAPAAPEPAPAKAEEPAPKAEAPAEEAKDDGVVTVNGTKVTIALEATNTMQFNTKRIEVPAGSEITLTLKHVGSLDKNVMGHNVVLLKAGTDGQKFALAGATHKDAGYVAPDHADAVIAKTDLVGGGESATITFTAPAPGEYPFLCSFPGHYALMNGVFVVK